MGGHLGADIICFVSENIGIGARYTRFRTSGELRSAPLQDLTTGQMRFGKISDDIAVRFIGPSFNTRVSAPDRKSHFISGVSVGHLAYRNNATVLDDFTLTGNTWGLVWDLGADVALSEHMSLGFTLSYTLGRLSQLNLNDGRRNRTIKLDEDELEGLSRIDLTIGLRLNK